jgi:hypothetical protein
MVEKALKTISEAAQWFDTPRNNQREDKKREDKKGEGGGKQPQGSNQPTARLKPGSAPRNTATSDTVCNGCGWVNHTIADWFTNTDKHPEANTSGCSWANSAAKKWPGNALPDKTLIDGTPWRSAYTSSGSEPRPNPNTARQRNGKDRHHGSGLDWHQLYL